MNGDNRKEEKKTNDKQNTIDKEERDAIILAFFTALDRLNNWR